MIAGPLLLLLLEAAAPAQQQPLAPQADTASPFLAVAPSVSDTLRFGDVIPEFEAKDISGRIWRREDLRGKYTLVYLWSASLAGATDRLDPHSRGSFHGLPNMPELQRFYDKARDTKNVQVLTFCINYDYMYAHDYMKQSGHTFPVIADWVLVRKLFPTVMEYCVIDPEGRISYPFHAWTLGRVLFEVERAAAGK